MMMSDSGELQASIRRAASAASVSSRWWENEGLAQGAADRAATTPAGSLGAPPPPPPPPQVAASPLALQAKESARDPEQQRLRLELEAAHDEIAALHEMLEDLPEIFERKFRQRVQGLVEEQQRLLVDNQLLRDRLYALTPVTPTALLPPAASRPARPGLRQAVRAALVSLRPKMGGPAAPRPPRLSSADDGRTTAA
jgi:hypothetical protein